MNYKDALIIYAKCGIVELSKDKYGSSLDYNIRSLFKYLLVNQSVCQTISQLVIIIFSFNIQSDTPQNVYK